MLESLQIRRLEEDLEQLRSKLIQSVNGEYSSLLAPHVLPLSQQLDQYILEYYQLKSQLQTH
ncbi:aspartyl-phosphate phosphatase Spo0E family protein [Thermoflavimicrobium daqui]|nr:aspartyl-phosphate phosphatase Spo0E family protein [Thermoflavimicrobium daqui]